MRAISNRVRKLEGRFGLSVATEADLRLWEKIEACRRSRAERMGEPFVPRPFGSPVRDEIRGLSIVEILHRGRLRNARNATDNVYYRAGVTVCPLVRVTRTR